MRGGAAFGAKNWLLVFFYRSHVVAAPYMTHDVISALDYSYKIIITNTFNEQLIHIKSVLIVKDQL